MTEEMIDEMEEEYLFRDDEPCSDDFRMVLTGEEKAERDYFGDEEPGSDDFKHVLTGKDETPKPDDFGDEEPDCKYDEMKLEDLYSLFHDDEPCSDDFVEVPTDPESDGGDDQLSTNERNPDNIIPVFYDSDDGKCGEEYEKEEIERFRRIRNKNN